jgi:CelD/BcsL family acetyltransferase involved in cellulose biosynthesis
MGANALTRTMDRTNGPGANYHRASHYRRQGLWDVATLFVNDLRIGRRFSTMAPRYHASWAQNAERPGARGETVLSEPTASLVEDPAELLRWRRDWDELATIRRRPFCAPDWLLAWWMNARPRDARLRVVVVHEGPRLIGIAPFFQVTNRIGVRSLRPLADRACQRVEPLAAAGREVEVARAVARALARASAAADAVFFEGIDAGSAWPDMLARAWPDAPGTVLHRSSGPAPTLELRGRDFDSWLAGKSRNFRHDLRKKRNAFVRQGGRFRVATLETLERDLQALARLHYGRWTHRGGSAALTTGVEAMLLEAGRALVPRGRFRLWSLERDGYVLASHLALTAGDEYGYWLAGFDERYGRISPSLLGALAIVQDAFACGAQRLDLGIGDVAYKRRFADGEETLAYVRMVPAGRRHLLARTHLLPGQLRSIARERTPEDVRIRLKGVENRIRRRP